MIISPKFRGFICTTAHPAGCEQNVRDQVSYVKQQGYVEGPKKVLVIGASTGFGLASRIVSAFGCGASTLGIFFERPASGNRTATPGWYNSAAFERMAGEAGYYAKSINGDAFSNQVKNQAIQLIKEDLGQVDMVIYSLASPRRVHPDTGETFNSVLKPIGREYTSKTVDFHTYDISDVSIQPANEDEIDNTVKVMGGEDWEMWMDALKAADVLAKGAVTVAYSYIGPEMTYAVYREGTIGRAKDHLEATAFKIADKLKEIDGKAFVSVNKALVTQASSAIPVIPLYVSALFKVMKEKGLHEGCIEQMYRLFADRLYSASTPLDEKGRIRIDDLEMKDEVQKEVSVIWDNANTENVREITDIEGFRNDFFKLFGFGFENINYEDDVEIDINLPSAL